MVEFDPESSNFTKGGYGSPFRNFLSFRDSAISLQIFLDTLEFMLVYSGGKFSIDEFNGSHPYEVFAVLDKYRTNTIKMLEMECDTKAKYIEEIESKKSCPDFTSS
jgi:hypothetical protein